MDIRYSLRPLDQDIIDVYPQLFPNEQDKTPELLDWRFNRNPHGRGLFSVAEDETGRIVGLIGLVATRLRYRSETWSAFQAIDTVVDPSYRGRGVFVGLGTKAQDVTSHGAAVLWGFPNANAAAGWYRHLGWRNFGPVPMLIKPLRTGFALSRIIPWLRALDLPLVRTRRSTAHVYADPYRFQRDAERICDRFGAQLGITVDRTGDWLRWRLMDRPNADYRCCATTGALLATRVVDKHGARIAYLMDVLGDPEEALALLQAELAFAAARGAEIALAWCPSSSPTYLLYRKAGFWPFPARLRPVEINFGGRALLDGASAAEDHRRWYVSYLDSDTV